MVLLINKMFIGTEGSVVKIVSSHY